MWLCDYGARGSLMQLMVLSESCCCFVSFVSILARLTGCKLSSSSSSVAWFALFVLGFLVRMAVSRECMCREIGFCGVVLYRCFFVVFFFLV